MIRQSLRNVAVAWIGTLAMVFPAWGATCPKRPACLNTDKPAQVVIRFNTAQPLVDNSHSRQWIQEKARQWNTGPHPVGLTEAHLLHQMTNTFTICSDLRKTEQCVYLAETSVVVGYSDTKVFIANEYKPGSCEYRAIYQHEAEHVRILNGQQERFLPDFRTALQHLVNEIHPPSSKNPQQEQKKIMHKLEHFLREEFRHLEKALKTAHAAIDTTQNYATIQASCRKW